MSRHQTDGLRRTRNTNTNENRTVTKTNLKNKHAKKKRKNLMSNLLITEISNNRPSLEENIVHLKTNLELLKINRDGRRDVQLLYVMRV